MKIDIDFSAAPRQPWPLPWLWAQVGYTSTVVLVTTLGEAGHIAVEVNTWNTPVGSNMVLMQCTTYHDTYKNILTSGEFVFNYPTIELMPYVVRAGRAKREATLNEIETIGLTPLPSRMVRPPRIAECTAHLECRLIWHRATEVRQRGELVVVVGQVVAASVEDVEDIYKGRILYAEKDYYAPCPVDQLRKWPDDEE